MEPRPLPAPRAAAAADSIWRRARPTAAGPADADDARAHADPRRRRLPGATARSSRRPVSRTWSAPTSAARRARAAPTQRKPLIAFAQLSDVHVVDAQSPMRVEWTDRFDDRQRGCRRRGSSPRRTVRRRCSPARSPTRWSARLNADHGRPGDRQAAGARDPDRRQLRQLPAQRGALEHRRPRRRPGARRLRRPVPVGGRARRRPDVLRPALLAPARHAGRARRTTSHAASAASPTVPGLLDAARRPFQAAGAVDPVVLRLRQPRRPRRRATSRRRPSSSTWSRPGRSS